MTKSYIPISIGINCTARSSIHESLPEEHNIPYFPFDWCITGDLLDIARAINTKFKGYLSYIYVNKSNNTLDYDKIKKILLEKNYITKNEASRKYGGRPGGRPHWKSQIKQIYKNYPSIIELHYDFSYNSDKAKIQNRINRMNKVIGGKSPLLFIRVILLYPLWELSFFKYTYNEGLQNCHEFVDALQLDKKREFKVLFIHLTMEKDKDMYRHKTFGNIDAHEIHSTKTIKYNNTGKIFIIPYIKKYKLAVKL